MCQLYKEDAIPNLWTVQKVCSREWLARVTLVGEVDLWDSSRTLNRDGKGKRNYL